MGHQAMTMRVEIVSAEKSLFSGLAEMVVATGSLGELGILPGHMPLLTALQAGQVTVTKQGSEEEIFYISGGLLEVQPSIVTVLADTCIRAEDLDEAAAREAQGLAQSQLSTKQAKIDFSTAATEMARAAAQIRAIQKLKKKTGR